MSHDLKTAFVNILKYRFNLDEDKANEEEIVDSLRRNVEFKGTNLWALIFAILTASIGLNVNSTAVIIGAMLISPLMGPIMGLGLGAGIFDFQLIRLSLKNLLVAVIISLMASAFYFWISPLQEAQSELLARTTPTIWDVLIALFGGLAGIIASSRKNISNVIPGVAIATALMPPLCTAGYGIGTGNLYYFLGAFYLFLINSVFIGIATFLIIRFLKFKPVFFVNKATEIKMRKYVWTIAVLTIIPSMFLAYRFVEEEIFKQNLKEMIRKELDANNLIVINQNIKPGRRSATLLVYGEEATDSLLRVIRKRTHLYRLGDANIVIRQTMNNIPQPVAQHQMADHGIDARHAALMMEKDKKIRALEQKIHGEVLEDSLVYREFHALFAGTTELHISKTRLWKPDDPRDSVLFVYAKSKGAINRKQAQRWLEARYNTREIKLVIE